MGRMKKKAKAPAETKPPVVLKDMNIQALEEYRRLINTDSTLSKTWKDALTPLISEKIPDDLSPLQNLIDGVPDAEAQTIKN